MPNPEKLSKIMRHILDGSAVLFVGAGMSFLAKNVAGHTLPSGEQLKSNLHEETGTKKVFPLDKISNFYVKKNLALRSSMTICVTSS